MCQTLWRRRCQHRNRPCIRCGVGRNEQQGEIIFQSPQQHGTLDYSRAQAEANAAAPALQFLKDVAADATKYDAVREERVTELFTNTKKASYFDVQAGHLTGAKATSTNTLAGAVISLLKDALHNGKLNLARQLTAYLETDFADDKDVQEFLALEKQKYEAELAKMTKSAEVVLCS